MAYYQKTMAKIYGILAKPMEHSKGSTEREVYNNTDRPKEDRKISHKQYSSTPTRTRGIKPKHPKVSRREEKHIRADIKTQKLKTQFKGSIFFRRWFFVKANKIDKPLTRFIKKKINK